MAWPMIRFAARTNARDAVTPMDFLGDISPVSNGNRNARPLTQG